MNIVCCVKQIPSLDDFLRSSQPPTDQHTTADNVWNLNPFDYVAIEAALRIRDSREDTSVTILSLGSALAREAIKIGLAMGADEGILLNDPLMLGGDSYSTAVVLAAAIRQISVDLIFCGRQSADLDYGVTGLAIAELLDLPSISIARSVSIQGKHLQAERIFGDSIEVVEIPLPCLVTISNELGTPRYPKLSDIVTVSNKPIRVLSASDLALDSVKIGERGSRLTVEQIYLQSTDRNCEFIPSSTPEQMAHSLSKRLRHSHII